MSDNINITRIEPVVKDGGETAGVYIEGGSEQSGKVSGWVSMDTLREAERKGGRREVEKMARETIDMLIQQQREAA